MKLQIIGAFVVFGLGTAPVFAQSPTGSRAIKSSELQGLTWPRVSRTGPPKTEIMALQYLLRNQGFFKQKVDGDFDRYTFHAVRAFQKAKGLKVDGVVGPQTWPHLLVRLKKGDRGDAVRAVQIALRSVGDELGGNPFIEQEVNGIYGTQTAGRIRKYQKGYSDYLRIGKLEADGVVGARTWGALLGAYFADSSDAL